eukprot:CAMPEP_0114317840 /NCGR_PEP_ID=MMETSP0059-20121206/24166_1 /TAXON_ID=36894 /ORGANISM="Pyramimonas parkeae, Strain CCMP726" /LENGTH=109 /DNA_ID=CAMNT_0001444295 /DNA_START=60 /DNA_END=387 /DNA_ORIENTATION=+
MKDDEIRREEGEIGRVRRARFGGVHQHERAAVSGAQRLSGLKDAHQVKVGLRPRKVALGGECEEVRARRAVGRLLQLSLRFWELVVHCLVPWSACAGRLRPGRRAPRVR